jgi:hypothetical protein
MGLTTGGTAISVVGYDFQDGATLNLGGVPATDVVVVNGTTLTAVTGPHPAGPVDVVVINPGGESAGLPAGFIYAEAIYNAYLPLVGP